MARAPGTPGDGGARCRDKTLTELIDDAAQFRGEMTADECYTLLERNARREPMRFVSIPKESKLRPALFHYRCMFPHPLPVDHPTESVLENSVVMRKIQHLKAGDRCWHAVTCNKPWCLEELYMTGFPIDTPDLSGWTPLHLAAHFGYSKCVHILLAAGADPNSESIAGVTPLESAIAAGHTEVEAMIRSYKGGFRDRKPMTGYRSILDVIPSLPRVNTVADDLGRALNRRPYYLQY